jgi:hypothetical protein
VKEHSIPFSGLRGTKSLRLLLGAMFVLLCLPLLTSAQAGRGSISGVITDPTGAVVSGAKVTALNRATGVTLHTVANEAGLYSFVSLNPGLYVVTASEMGFESVAQKNVSVTVDQVTTVNIALKVGNVSDTVEVTSTTELTDPSNSTVGQLLDSATIDRVPLLTRNVFDLVQLSAGVTPANGTPNSSSSFQITNISSGRPGVDVSSYTINGAIQGSVYFMLDGSPLGIAENNIAAIIPALEIPEDGVDELRVETQNTSASYQSGGAGVISVVSKSGGDHFHGDAFGVFRPDVLSANDSFNKSQQLQAGQPNTPPGFHRYQAGGAIGGPILHKKLFFFGDYEYTQQQLFDPANSIFTVPTTKERAGDFSADNYTIYNPLVPDNSDGTRQEFTTHNVITSSTSLNPIAVKMLSMLPKCNFPNPATCDSATDQHLNNLRLPGLDPTTAHRFDVRIDFNMSEKQRFFTRFSYDRLFNSAVHAFSNGWDPFYAQNITNGRNFIIGDDFTISPTTVLLLRYSFTRHYEAQGGDPRQNGFDITTLGFPASLAAVQAFKGFPIAYFNTAGGGVGGTCCFNTFVYASQNHDASAALTKVLGKHELSFGAEYMKRFLNVGQPPSASGAYFFDVSATDQSTSAATAVGGSDFASFLLGIGTSPGTEGNFSQPNFTQDLFIAEASPYYAAFIQDTYHPFTSLTVTAGLRWDIFGGKTERHNRLEYFDPKANGTDPVIGPFTGGEVFASSSNRSPFTTNLKDFSPRLGLAWKALEHLVVRAGGGFYYGPSVQTVSGAGENSDGFSTSNTWNATCLTANGNSTYNVSNLCTGAAAGSPAPSTTGIFSLSNPFPTGLVPPSQLQPNGLQTGLGSVLNTMLHSQRTLLTYNYNFGMDYELPHQVVLSASYVGSRGLFLPLQTADQNQLTLSQLNQLGTAGATQAQIIAAEPFPQFNNGGSNNGVAVHGFPGGDSTYSSLQTKVQKRLTAHFTTLTSFTWAKLLTNDGNPPLGFVGSHAGAPQDWRNLNLERSVSPQDVKYQFIWQTSYDLPIGKGRALDLNGVSDTILGNWTAGGIFYLSSGVPIASPVVGGTNIFLANQRLNLTCDPSKGAPHTATAWFNPNCFAAPASLFVPGTAPPYLDHVRTMGANNLDLTLSKVVKLGETRNLRFDISSYNIANKHQYAAPTVSSLNNSFANFGQINSNINTPRQFQFGARFTF